MNKIVYKMTAVILILSLHNVLHATLPSGPVSSEEEKGLNKSGEKPLRILTLGDSNGALPFGWPAQLKNIRPDDMIHNISISGNTIGFINNGRPSLNTLINIGNYIDDAYKNLGMIDMVIMILGTNDCKSVFKDSMPLVPENMRKIIREIKLMARSHKNKPEIFIVSPPPFGPDELVGEKYAGGLERITWLNRQLADIAKEENVNFINSFNILLPVFKYLSADGVHLNADGQKMTALIIQENLKYTSRK